MTSAWGPFWRARTRETCSSAGWASTLADLPEGARVGTGSLRRQAQLRAFRPDLQIRPLRGNVDTRLRKSSTEDYDAVVLAFAGLRRLGLADHDHGDPAAGCDASRPWARERLPSRCAPTMTRTLALGPRLDDAATRAASEAERSFLRELGGGCHVPIAAHGGRPSTASGCGVWWRIRPGQPILRGAIHGPRERRPELGATWPGNCWARAGVAAGLTSERRTCDGDGH